MALILPEEPLLKMGRALLVCLEEQYTKYGVTAPGSFCLRAGEDGSIVEDLDPFSGDDLCCSGLGFVRIGGEYPSSNFPELDTYEKRNACFPLAWAGELQVGIMRCYVPGAGSGANFAMPTCPQHTQAAVNYGVDLMLLKMAICCWTATLPKGRLYQIGTIGPSGPRANCIQTLGSILVGVPKCC